MRYNYTSNIQLYIKYIHQINEYTSSIQYINIHLKVFSSNNGTFSIHHITNLLTYMNILLSDLGFAPGFFVEAKAYRDNYP